MIRYSFHTTVHALPRRAHPDKELEINGTRVRCLAVEPAMLAESIPLSFEEAAERLRKLPRMFLEPDGSFVCASAQAERRWQVEGVLYDRDGRLMFVDLKGECPEEYLDQLLIALGGDLTPLMFQLVRQAIFLDEHDFRRCSQMKSTER